MCHFIYGDSETTGASNGRLQEQVADLEEQLRLSTEKITQLQRAEERSRAAYEAARNELKVAQAYVQQLAGTGAEDGAGGESFTTGEKVCRKKYVAFSEMSLMKWNFKCVHEF